MTDYFALLNEPRRPMINIELLKEHFHRLSSEAHPDRFHNDTEVEKQAANQRYTELNTAYNCLKETKDRLLHLLELESGSKPKDIQRIPPGTMDLFVEVGQICRDVDAFIAERAKVTSPMLKVQMFQKGMEWTDRLQALQQKVNLKRDELNQEMSQMNELWEKAEPVGSDGRLTVLPLERLEQIYRIHSYIGRWTAQIQERVAQLM